MKSLMSKEFTLKLSARFMSALLVMFMLGFVTSVSPQASNRRARALRKRLRPRVTRKGCGCLYKDHEHSGSGGPAIPAR